MAPHDHVLHRGHSDRLWRGMVLRQRSHPVRGGGVCHHHEHLELLVLGQARGAHDEGGGSRSCAVSRAPSYRGKLGHYRRAAEAARLCGGGPGTQRLCYGTRPQACCRSCDNGAFGHTGPYRARGSACARAFACGQQGHARLYRGSGAGGLRGHYCGYIHAHAHVRRRQRPRRASARPGDRYRGRYFGAHRGNTDSACHLTQA